MNSCSCITLISLGSENSSQRLKSPSRLKTRPNNHDGEVSRAEASGAQQGQPSAARPRSPADLLGKWELLITRQN